MAYEEEEAKEEEDPRKVWNKETNELDQINVEEVISSSEEDQSEGGIKIELPTEEVIKKPIFDLNN